jgi:hypothetical protein
MDDQFRLQAPGPRGSPHVPQPPLIGWASRALVLPDEDTAAKTENCFSSFWLRQAGHPGCCEPVTSVSNRCWQSEHTYSKMGIPAGYSTRRQGAVLSQDSNDLMALQNAVQGVLAASERVREVAPSVTGLDLSASIKDVDLAQLHSVAMAQAIAAQALRGYVEELQRKMA